MFFLVFFKLKTKIIIMQKTNKGFKIKSKKKIGFFQRNPKSKKENGTVLIKSNTHEIQKNSKQKKSTFSRYEKIKIDNYILYSHEKKMIKKSVSQNFNCEVMQTKISQDDNKIVITLMNGSLYFLNNKNLTKSFFHTVEENVPLTSLIWKNNKTFYLGNTNGSLFQYEFSKEANKLELINQFNDKKEDQIFSIDYNPALEQLLYAGKNMTINLLDDEKKQIIHTYDKGDSYQAGHTNRIFCVKYIKDQPNLFISAGWDGTMFLWDTRVSKNVDSVYGPTISGDSLDVKGNLILAGSYRDRNCLELYDLRVFKKLCDIETKTNLGENLNYVSSCKFGKGKNSEDYVIAGSCISNLVGIFKKDLVYKPDVVITRLKSSVYSVGFGNKENKFYFSTSEGKFNIYHYFNM